MASPAPLAIARRTDGLEYDPEIACRYLTEADPRLGDLIAQVGEFTMRPPPSQSLFAALMRSIVYQQLSGKAAATILDRTIRTCTSRSFPSPRELLQVPIDELRAAGLSAAKTAAVRDLAQKTLEGTVPSLARVRRMSDEEVVQRLTEVRGIGTWTVEMLLLFRLGRPDVFPIMDLGVRKGFGLVFRRGKLPEPRTMFRRGERWRPYRSIASWYLWRALEL
jgi:DNA-3-methyladenine glycosylase II